MIYITSNTVSHHKTEKINGNKDRCTCEILKTYMEHPSWNPCHPVSSPFPSKLNLSSRPLTQKLAPLLSFFFSFSSDGRRPASNFLGQARFRKITAQILNSSESQRCMQTFKRYSVSFKNYCLFQLKITLGNISSLNLIFFTARKNYPVETMLRRTRWISDQIGRQAIFF